MRSPISALLANQGQQSGGPTTRAHRRFPRWGRPCQSTRFRCARREAGQEITRLDSDVTRGCTLSGMSYSIGKVAEIAGVTVRTLHHYDEIGLLSPSDRTSTGYRRYDDADLDRLQQIRFYRELDFPLEEIAAILDDPDADPMAHLRRQHGLLSERIAKL